MKMMMACKRFIEALRGKGYQATQIRPEDLLNALAQVLLSSHPAQVYLGLSFFSLLGTATPGAAAGPAIIPCGAGCHCCGIG